MALEVGWEIGLDYQEDSEFILEEVFKTTEEGYKAFSDKMHEAEESRGCSVELAIETTGNARFFKNRMKAEGFGVVVVNTNKFKVITMRPRRMMQMMLRH